MSEGERPAFENVKNMTVLLHEIADRLVPESMNLDILLEILGGQKEI
ncbi:hypothetical protein BH10ACI2_BH10ACI2_15650 [soil metagenome]